MKQRLRKQLKGSMKLKKKNWFCENMNTNNPLARFIKKERERAEINKIR